MLIIQLITCAIIRAVHLELTESMSLIDCMQALRGPAGLRRSKFRETSLFLKKFSLSRVAFEKM